MKAHKKTGWPLCLIGILILFFAISCDGDNPVDPTIVLGKPVVTTPLNSTVDQSVTPTLQWSCEGAEKYDVYFGISSSPALVSSDQTGTSYSPEELEVGAMYYWKVVAKDGTGGTTSSNVWHFTTLGPDLFLVDITDADTDVALVLKKYYEGRKLIVLADTTDGGQIATVTGGAYEDPGGEIYSFWFGNDGLPEYAVIGRDFFYFYGYTNATVNIKGRVQNAWFSWPAVDVDAGALDSLRNLVSGGLPDLVDPAEAIRVVSLGLRIGACAISVGAAAIPGISVPVADSTCSATSDDWFDGGSAEISTFTCALQDSARCESLGLDALADNISIDTQTRDDGIDEGSEVYIYRLNLTWGENPRDLDAHFWTPEIWNVDEVDEDVIDTATAFYHVFFSDMGSADTPPYAQLDADDKFGYGPENITINLLFPGTYYYSIHHWASVAAGTITTSDAHVRIYDAQDILLNSLDVPYDSADSSRWWNVLEIDGITGAITIINEIDTIPSGASAWNNDWEVPKGE